MPEISNKSTGEGSAPPLLAPTVVSLLPALPLGWTALQHAVLNDGALAILADDQQVDAHAFRGQEASDPEAFRRRIDLATGRIWTFDGLNLTAAIEFPLETPFPAIDRTPAGDWVVVARRTEGKANARLFTPDGNLVRRLMLGDGVQAMQVDASARIWVGWFDEGVFGNETWKVPGREWPPSSSVIACFDLSGEVVWELPFEPNGPADCYALNVMEDTAWAWTYRGYPLHRLRPGAVPEHWDTDLGDPTAIAIEGGLALLAGEYGDGRDQATLVRMEGGEVITLAHWTLDLPAEPAQLSGRGSMLHATSDVEWRRWDAKAVAELVKG